MPNKKNERKEEEKRITQVLLEYLSLSFLDVSFYMFWERDKERMVLSFQ
jgi:hypothetical protein